MIVTGSTVDLSKQAELTTITAAQIDDLAEGSAIIYRKQSGNSDNLIYDLLLQGIFKSYPALGFISKDGTITDLPYPGTEIKGLIVPPIPNTLPNTNKAYALGLVEVSSAYKFKWVLVDTDGNFNSVPPSYYYITASAAECYNYDATLNDLFLNGSILVDIYGWDVNTPKKYSLDGGMTFSGIVTEQYDGGNLAYFTIPNLGDTSITGQTIDLVIADSDHNILYPNAYSATGSTIIASPIYSVYTTYEGLDNNGLFDVNLIKLQDISATSVGVMEVVVTDPQVGCEYYYEIWDYGTSTMLFYRDYSPSKSYQFAITAITPPTTQLFAVVYKKTPGRILVGGIDLYGFGSIGIDHFSLLYSKDGTDLTTYYNLAPNMAGGYTEVLYTPSEADGIKELCMKTNANDCIYKKVVSFVQTGNSLTTVDMLMLEYTGDTISNNLFDYPVIGGTPVNVPIPVNTYFTPIDIKTIMFGGGSSLIFAYTFLGAASTFDTTEILFYDAVSGQPISGTGAQTPSITTTGYVTIDVKYKPYWDINQLQSIMIRFKHISNITGRTYYSDLIHIRNV